MAKTTTYSVRVYVKEEDVKDLERLKKQGIPYAEVLREGIDSIKKKR